jgi:hypothetical protein
MLWYLKQLLPLTYWSTYEVYYDKTTGQESDAFSSDSSKKVCFSIWKMWFGKVYDLVTIEI